VSVVKRGASHGGDILEETWRDFKRARGGPRRWFLLLSASRFFGVEMVYRHGDPYMEAEKVRGGFISSSGTARSQHRNPAPRDAAK
jgi:hypothetical protein